jgi:hypothetical protein
MNTCGMVGQLLRASGAHAATVTAHATHQSAAAPSTRT